MLTQTQFNLIRPWALMATNLPEIVLSDQSAPRPKVNYGLFNLIGSKRIGQEVDVTFEANPAWVDENSDMPPFWYFPVQEWEFDWSFNIYSANAMDTAIRLNPWVTTQAGRESLFPLNPFPIKDFINLPELINGKFHDRVMLNIRMRVYICEGAADFNGSPVILGRVPVDVAEQANFNFYKCDADGEVFVQALQIDKP